MRPMANELSTSQSEHGSTSLGTGSPDVLVHNGKAWRAEQDEFNCPIHGPEKVPIGHTQVLVNGKQATRVGDFLLGAGPADQIQSNNQVLLGEEGVGLESPEGMQEWCREWCQLEADWASLTPDQRRERYKEMVGRMYDNFGGPRPEIVFVPPKLGEDGKMEYTGGYIEVGSGQFGVGDQYFSEPRPGDLRRVTFHEVRHGQQLFYGVRYARQRRRAGNPLPNDVSPQKTGGLNEAADRMPDFVPGSREEAWARTMAEGYCRYEGMEQLGWANQKYGERYPTIPGGADANRIDAQPNTACAC